MICSSRGVSGCSEFFRLGTSTPKQLGVYARSGSLSAKSLGVVERGLSASAAVAAQNLGWITQRSAYGWASGRQDRYSQQCETSQSQRSQISRFYPEDQ